MSSHRAEDTNRAGTSRQLCELVARLAREASVEIAAQDERHLDAARAFLGPGTRVYISHLPGQQWDATVRACAAVSRAGFDPIAHVPVRLLETAAALERLLESIRSVSAAREVLLISGDYPRALGPFDAVSQVLGAGLLERHGFVRVSIAGHPEGHPRVSLEDIRAAELEKVQLAADHGLEVTLLTQFLFELAPFVDWVNEHARQQLRTRRYVCGLAGPAKITTLMRYAMRCGVGASIRALSAHPGSVRDLVKDHGPERMLRQLAETRVTGACTFSGVHMFCFGGFLRTAHWLSSVAEGECASPREI